ncbi:MAG TPA: rhomboid family intramembrane serine protease [Burkholderiaceae bacterium]|nr:rhomboid family intramembrane serine protease [Burkholderiaceae bacterium]
MLPLPPVTKALMLICTAVFFADQLLENSFSLGMWFALWPLNSGYFYPWQLVTYAFLHGGLAHLIFNMLGLWMFGAELERLWGHKRYWQMLLASTLTAALAQLLLTWVLGSNVPTVGASGALFGLLLAYALVFPRRQFDLIGFLPMVLLMIPGQIFYTLGIVLFVLLVTNRQIVPLKPIPVPALTTVMIFGAIELILGVTGTRSGVAHFAHLGGMLGAWLLLLYWRGRLPLGRRR